MEAVKLDTKEALQAARLAELRAEYAKRIEDIDAGRSKSYTQEEFNAIMDKHIAELGEKYGNK